MIVSIRTQLKMKDEIDLLLFCFPLIFFSLAYFIPLVSFYTSWKNKKIFGFLIFPEGKERDQ